MGRYKLLWRFVKMLPHAKAIELEVQAIQQNAHNLEFFDQVYRGNQNVETAHAKGMVKGIEWALKRFEGIL